MGPRAVCGCDACLQQRLRGFKGSSVSEREVKRGCRRQTGEDSLGCIQLRETPASLRVSLGSPIPSLRGGSPSGGQQPASGLSEKAHFSIWGSRSYRGKAGGPGCPAGAPLGPGNQVKDFEKVGKGLHCGLGHCRLQRRQCMSIRDLGKKDPKASICHPPKTPASAPYA